MERSDVAAPRRAGLIQHLALAIVYLPLLATAPGRVVADTKTYLYIDPARVLMRAPWMWDPNTGFGTVSHQTIGYLFPMGPWFWLFDVIGAPAWVAQRLWIGTILFSAGAGVLFLIRTLRGLKWTAPAATAAIAAAFVYMLTPYTLQYASRLSALLLPWAGLPWLLALIQRALRTGGWKHPAIFALVVATVGSVNATALLLVGIAPLLWVVFAVWVHGEVRARAAAAAVGRIGLLTTACSLWWLGGLLVQGGYGVNVLRYSETVATVASTSIASEVLRGLGYWFFYGGDKLGAWVDAGPPYMRVVWLLGASFAVPLLAFMAAVLARWRYRSFAVAMIAIGTAVAVGAYPYDSPPPAGALFKAFADKSSAGLSMRSTPRAVPLLVLGIALLIFAGLAALGRRRSKTGFAASALVIVITAAAMQPLWVGDFLGANLMRAEELPPYWHEAADHLDARPHDTRVLELPGMDFAAYRWGQTVDPITPGLIDRPYAARELIPQGSPATADLLNALDRRLQEGLFDPSAVAPVARLMGVGDVVLRSDVQYERFRTPRPRETWAQFQDAPGLRDPFTFGDGQPNVPEARFPLEDELELVTPADAPHPPQVAVFPVRGARPIVSAEESRRPVLLAGDGEGLVHAAAAGVVDGEAPVLYSGSLAGKPALRDVALDAGARLVLTDSNRRRARQWRTLLETFGYTEPRGSRPLRRDLADNRLVVFPDAEEDAYTSARHSGVREVRATSYGNATTYTPENRATNAFDGDVETAWRTADFTGTGSERIEVELEEPTRVDAIEVVQPVTGATNRFITEIEVRLDGKKIGRFTLDESSRRPRGQRLRIGDNTFRTLSLAVVADSVGRLDNYSGMSPVGFAEIRIPTLDPVEEIIDLPRDLLSNAGKNSQNHDLTILLERIRWNPLLTTRNDAELSMIRGFALPTSRSFALSGTARLSAFAPSHIVDELMSIPSAASGGLTVITSSSLHGSIANRGSMAVDGDLETIWRTGFREETIVGSWIEVEMAAPTRIDRLDMRIVADGRHSVPTRVRIEGGGEMRVVDVPAVTDSRARDTIVKVPLRFAPLEASRLRVVLEKVRPAYSHDYYDQEPIMRPVGVAELGIPGVQRPAPNQRFDTGCRTDLLELDGRPIPVRVIGPTAAANARAPLSVETCSGSAVTIRSGEHVLRTRKGVVSALDIDSLVLHSLGRRGKSDLEVDAPVVSVDGHSRTTYDLTVAAAGEPFWLVLRQSHNVGWSAVSPELGDLGEPVLINGFANGWYVDPKKTGDLSVHLEWTPQAPVWAALVGSSLGALLCAGIAFAPLVRRRRAHIHPATAPDPILQSPAAFPWEPSKWRAPLHAAGCGVVAALVAGAWVGGAVFLSVLVAMLLGRRGRILLTGGAVVAFAVAAGSVVSKTWLQGGPPPGFQWPSYSGHAHYYAYVGVMLLVSDAAIAPLLRRRDDRLRSGQAPPASPERSHPT